MIRKVPAMCLPFIAESSARLHQRACKHLTLFAPSRSPSHTIQNEINSGRSAGEKCQLLGCPSQARQETHQPDAVHYDFCCRGHAELARARGEWPPTSCWGSSICSLPGCKKVVYRNPKTGQESKCCSLRHIKTAASRECRRNGCSRTALYANTKGITQMCCSRACEDAVYEQPLWPARQTHCRLVGCSEFSMRVGTTSFCSEAHRLEEEYRRGAVRSQMRLLREPWWISGEPYTRSTTCSSYEPYTCSSTRVSLKGGAEPSFTLRVLDAAHPEYDSLQEQFVSTWQHENTAYRVAVVSIVKIEMPKEVRQRHQEYKRDVPNSRRRFHGTSCSVHCDFYVKASGTACMLSNCCVCSICLRGFEIAGYVGLSSAKRTRKLQYGQGLYFSSSSGKANDFTSGTQKLAGDGTARRCMFVADVAAGNAYKTHAKDLPEWYCPPQGYHSVVAEVGPNVNYDQLVVYDKAAALPTHFVVYKC